LLPHDRNHGLGDVDDAEEVGLDLRAEFVDARVLYGADVAIARVVDEHVESPESVDTRRDGVARRGDEIVPASEDRIGERAAQAA
jgi:hypothetical protein